MKRRPTILTLMPLFLLALVLSTARNSVADPNIAALLSQPPSADIGQKTTCAYCGMHLKVKQNTPGATYKGKNYYFCDEMERDAFVKNPEKYISSTPASRAASHAQPPN